MKKAVVFFADGTEEIEAIFTIDILRRAGVEVTTAAVSQNISADSDRTVTGAHGIPVVCDCLVQKAEEQRFDLVVIPGGMPGMINIASSEAAKRIILSVHDAGGYAAAICAGPSVLGALGLLKGKKAVCYPGFEHNLTGAQISKERVCVDGRIITAVGPGAAEEFSFALVSLLCGKDTAERLAKAVIVR